MAVQAAAVGVLAPTYDASNMKTKAAHAQVVVDKFDLKELPMAECVSSDSPDGRAAAPRPQSRQLDRELHQAMHLERDRINFLQGRISDLSDQLVQVRAKINPRRASVNSRITPRAPKTALRRGSMNNLEPRSPGSSGGSGTLQRLMSMPVVQDLKTTFDGALTPSAAPAVRGMGTRHSSIMVPARPRSVEGLLFEPAQETRVIRQGGANTGAQQQLIRHLAARHIVLHAAQCELDETLAKLRPSREAQPSPQDEFEPDDRQVAVALAGQVATAQKQADQLQAELKSAKDKMREATEHGLFDQGFESELTDGVKKRTAEAQGFWTELMGVYQQAAWISERLRAAQEQAWPNMNVPAVAQNPLVQELQQLRRRGRQLEDEMGRLALDVRLAEAQLVPNHSIVAGILAPRRTAPEAVPMRALIELLGEVDGKIQDMKERQKAADEQVASERVARRQSRLPRKQGPWLLDFLALLGGGLCPHQPASPTHSKGKEDRRAVQGSGTTAAEDPDDDEHTESPEQAAARLTKILAGHYNSIDDLTLQLKKARAQLAEDRRLCRIVALEESLEKAATECGTLFKQIIVANTSLEQLRKELTALEIAKD